MGHITDDLMSPAPPSRWESENVDQLCGVWSLEWSGLYHSSFEDETLAFAADGTGWFQFARPGLADVTYFTWRRVPDAELRLDYHQRRIIVDRQARAEADLAFPSAISYRLSEEDTPLGGQRLLLRIKPAMMFAREFGLRTRDVEGVRPEET